MFLQFVLIIIMSKNSYANSLNRDVLKYLPVKILPAFAGVFTIFLLTRTLSTFLYADYVFLMATVLLFGQLIGGWINSSVLYFYPDYVANNSIDVLKINVILLQLILFLLGSVAYIITSYLGLKNFEIVIIGLLLILSQTFLNLLYSFLQAERRIFIQIRSTIIQSLIQIIGIGICFFFYKEKLDAVFLVLFLSYFFASNYVMYCEGIFRLIFNKQHLLSLDFRISKKILFYGLPICVWFFATQFYAIGDRILFNYFKIDYLVSNYASFRDLSVGLSGFLTMPLLMASHPIIIQMWKSNENLYKIEKIIADNIKLLITLFTPIFMGVFLLGDWVLMQVVGEKYLLDTNLMFLVLISIFLGTVSMYLHKGLEVTGRTMLMTKIALVVAVLSLLLNVILIPIFGVLGACLVAVFSQLMYCFLIYFFSKRIIKIKIPILFIFKNLFLILIAFLLANYVFELSSHLLLKLITFFLLTIYLFFSSFDLKMMIRLISRKI